MTVAALPATISYIEDGATTVFAVPYRFKAAGDLVVERISGGDVSRLALGVDYSATGGETDAGGTLTRTAATSGATLRITRATARTQPMEYTVGDRFPATSHEQALDRCILIDQEQDVAIGDIRLRALLLAPGATGGAIPLEGGPFIALDADNRPYRSHGTGADLGLRADLGTYLGTSLIGFQNSGRGSRARTLQSLIRDFALNPRDYGAIGDGYYHSLSEQFATLAAAQVAYPFATALTQSLDWAGIQAALNEAARDVNRRGVVQLPLGYFILSDGLKIASNTTFRGVSRFGAVINNQGHLLNAPVFTNSDPAALINTTLENFAVLGGTHVIKIDVTTESAGIRMRDIAAYLQTVASIEANMLQTTKIITCDFDGGGGAVNGLLSTGPTCNDVSVVDTRFTNHSGAKIKLAGFNGFYMSGGSCEGGGDDTVGTNTLDLRGLSPTQYSAAAVFRSVYFERTQQRLLYSRDTRGVAFDGCTFMGHLASGVFVGYTFDTDADVISFGSNHWYRRTTGPANMSVSGANDNLLAQSSNAFAGVAGRYGTLAPKQRSLSAGTTFNLIHFHRASGAPNDDTNQQGIVGTLRLHVKATDSINGVARYGSFVHQVSADALGAGNIAVNVPAASSSVNNLGPMTVTVQAKAGATPNDAYVEVVIANVLTTQASVVAWTFDWSGMSTIDANQMQVIAP
ncbi:MAG: hypothetical protein P0Y64_02115 [Candidatus Sphingomonas colombiensis]|nr:hypothetical protein [Sphingomonas sp.]WEK43651.1 MAG: hypothetical protein P0Y64_02115 [Sphingomonas sp.]